MGRYTSEKSEFDELAKKFFELRGYRAELLGGGLADVAAWNPKSGQFAIVEVKSPSERDADINYRYKEENYDLCGKPRKEVWEVVTRQGFAPGEQGIARLVAFTVSNQLYTYWWRAEKHIQKFRQKTAANVSPSCLEAFLVLPAEYEPIAKRIIASFREIPVPRVTRHGKISVFEISYPSPIS